MIDMIDTTLVLTKTLRPGDVIVDRLGISFPIVAIDYSDPDVYLITVTIGSSTETMTMPHGRNVRFTRIAS